MGKVNPGDGPFKKEELMEELSQMYDQDLQVLRSEVFERLLIGEDTLLMEYLV